MVFRMCALITLCTSAFPPSPFDSSIMFRMSYSVNSRGATACVNAGVSARWLTSESAANVSMTSAAESLLRMSVIRFMDTRAKPH